MTKDKNQDNNQDISKSQRKRDAKKLQDLAGILLQAPASVFNNIPLPEALENAVLQGRNITSHVARKRQMQFIAKLLRRHDLDPILAAIDEQHDQSRRNTLRFHIVEQWRDLLIELGDKALAEFCRTNPDTDRQHFRQLIRNARRELASGKPPVSQRLLFKLLRDVDERSPLSAPDRL